jgi:hypothetical protein
MTMTAKHSRHVSCLAALLLAVGLASPGCSRRTATVRGTVTYQNKKVTSGVVVFVGADGKATQPAPIQEDGTYTAANVPVGTVKVAVDNPPPPSNTGGAGLSPTDPEAQAAAKEAARYTPTPPQYRDANKSGLTTTVKPGSNTYNVDLTGTPPAG